jgi:hypothetical protein
VRQYLKVHEGAPEAGVARETTTVKKVAEFGELFDKGQTMGEPTSVQSKQTCFLWDASAHGQAL